MGWSLGLGSRFFSADFADVRMQAEFGAGGEVGIPRSAQDDKRY